MPYFPDLSVEVGFVSDGIGVFRGQRFPRRVDGPHSALMAALSNFFCRRGGQAMIAVFVSLAQVYFGESLNKTVPSI